MAKEFAKRFGSLFLAAVFLFTTIGLTGLIYLQTRSQTSTADEQAELQEQLSEQSSCNIQTPVPAEAEKEPAVFKPEDDVKELTTTDLEVGTGEEAKQNDCLVVKYHGTLAESGEKFDGNFEEKTALQFLLGTGTVIQGWDQGLVGIKEGGTRRIVIPSELGYGESGAGSIPPNADLVFVVKLLEIKEL